MRNLGWLGGAAMLTLFACQPRETPQRAQDRMAKESDAFKQAIASIERRYEAWVAAGQADSIAATFTDQGREMPPGEPSVVGRAAIGKYEAQSASMLESKLTLRSEAAAASGPIGIERGAYIFEGKAKKGAPKGTPASFRDEGKYLVHWENVNGEWQIADQIWNSNAPPHAMTAAAKPKPAAKKPTSKKK